MAELAPKAGEADSWLELLEMQPTKIEPAPTKTEPAPTETEPAPKTEPAASSSKRPTSISLSSEQASKYFKLDSREDDAWLASQIE